MKKVVLIAVVMSLLSVCGIGQVPVAPSANPVPVIIPQPDKVVMGEGMFKVGAKVVRVPENESKKDVRIKKAFDAFAEVVNKYQKSDKAIESIPYVLGIDMDVIGENPRAAAHAKAEGLTVPAQAEGYALSISKYGITLIGRDDAGLFHGLMDSPSVNSNQR